MDPYIIIDKYYSDNEELKHILLTHSEAVAAKAMEIVRNHPELNADIDFIREAALLHDIGIFLTNAPGIACNGTHPYIAHGYLGADLLRKDGFDKHALVCERHTGTGLSLELILQQDLPVPHRDMQPVSIEEQIICFADKFFSKTRIYEKKTLEQARKSLIKFGDKGVEKFDKWCKSFI